ncbi:type 2 lantipeptide synthetase LanM family protein [Streptomyces sp. ISL-66]|uniref:type 2 lanthipeptide synthetase LanM family protein n=1 Tax=Streptomyces sp. ISL-66 TaxID=2819186 RepID=UPI001BE91D3C|nr:type 2 lanthipeptide synthetase LanM family protein [Streptomyces sp. ISL-66]MBT2470441.1 type 2 lantipeptide synthetase LanM family protein [Streptomyces sp. ISL-66]
MLDAFLDDARWWAGLTPAERRTAGGIEPDPEEGGRGTARVRLWQGGLLVPGLRVDPDVLAARWGVAPGRLALLAAESPRELKLRLPGTPEWVRVLVDAWRRFPGEALPGDAPGDALPGPASPALPAPSAADGAATDWLGTPHWLGPLAAWAREELRGRLGSAGRLPDGHPLFAPDTATLRTMVQRTLVLEINAARLEGRLDGATPEARYEAFGAELRDPVRALDLLAGHPVLARGLVDHVRRWVEVRAEFAERLSGDFPELRERFAIPGEGLRDVADIVFGAGDAHRGGRTVAVVGFRDAAGYVRLVYKPRSLAVDTHVNGLLDWINDRGPRHPLRTSELLERPGHGWCAFVDAAPCADAAALGRFAWRLGAHLALFHVLGCSDMHLENLIAAGEHPAFIDLEAIFHTESADPADADPVDLLLRASVLAVGLLPQRVVKAGGTGPHAMEISAMAGGPAPGELELRPELVLAGAGTDRVRSARERIPVPESGNRPVLDGRPADPSAMLPRLIEGFEDCYRLLLAGRDELVPRLDAFAGDEVRAVLRNTSAYRALLEEAWHPDLLGDGLDRAYLMEALDPDGEGDAAVLASERGQLARGDVPAFTARPCGTALSDDGGVVTKGFFQRSGLESARLRLAALSEEHLREQLWFVHASLATRELGGHAQERVREQADGQGQEDGQAQEGPVAVGPRGRPGTAPEPDPDAALAAASRIGDRLLASALRGEDGVVEWVNLNLVGERYWVVGSSGLGLYSGVTGIALFLAELAAVTGVERYEHAAREVVDALADPDGMPEPEDLRGMPVGGYEDLCGVLFLLARAGRLWEAPALLDAARSLVPAVRQNLEDDAPFDSGDVVDGVAGTALALIALDAGRPGEATREAVRRAGEILLGREPLPGDVPGFGHGRAGRAYALSAIAGHTGEPRFAEAAARTVAEDRSVAGTDPRTRAAAGTGTGAGINAWCRGAAGTLLAAARPDGAALTGSPELSAVREDLRAGVGNDSLCHGTLGLAEALRAAGESAGDPALVDEARRAATAVAHRVLAGDVRTGVPRRLWVPGLMNGAAGIGYGLLRTALPGRAVPDVLRLGT